MRIFNILSGGKLALAEDTKFIELEEFHPQGDDHGVAHTSMTYLTSTGKLRRVEVVEPIDAILNKDQVKS